MAVRNSAASRLARANANMGVGTMKIIGRGSRDEPEPERDVYGLEYSVGELGDQAGGESEMLRKASMARDRGTMGPVGLGMGAQGSGHGVNLAMVLAPEALSTLGTELVDEVENCKDSRADWTEQMLKGIRRLGFDRSSDKRETPFPGASNVVSPGFAQACVDLQARLAGQLAPPDGPAKAKVDGEPSPDRTEAADRVARYINWQCTKQMGEWSPEADRLFMLIGAEGSSFKKLWWDADSGRPRTSYVSSEFVIMPYSASDEHTSPLLAEELRVLEHVRQGYVATGYWAEHDPGPAPMFEESELERARKALTGMTPSSHQIAGHDPHIYYECQVRRQIKEIPGPDGQGPREWLVTIHKQSRQVVAIYRHWDQDDPARERRRLLLHYKLFPWVGPYGIGLWHLIGGLSHAATGTLRALLDAAMASVMGGGLKAGFGKSNGAQIISGPGIWADVSLTGTDDIRKALLPNIFQPPSSVLLELLQWLKGEVAEFASVALREIADSTEATPVGTTLARLDEGSRVFCGVYQRMHRVQSLELGQLYKIDAKTLPQQLTFRPFFDPKLSPADFGRDISVSPVSDPRTYSAVQRQMKAQARLQLGVSASQLGVKVDMRDAHMVAGEAMGLPDLETLFPEDPPPVSADPFSENLAAFRGSPLQAKPVHPHEEHLMVHLAAALLPGLVSTPSGTALIAHMQEHATMGALAMAAAGMMVKQADPALGLKEPTTDPGAWYAQWMGQIGKAMLPPGDPAIEAVARVEEAKVDADRERVATETAAKKEIVGVETQAKKEIEAAKLAAALEKIDAEGEAKEAELVTDARLKREDNATRERIATAQIMAKAATPPPPPRPTTPPGKATTKRKRP